MNLLTVRKTILVLAFLIFVGEIGYWLGANKAQFSFANNKPEIIIDRNVPSSKKDVDFTLFWNVWDKVEATYLNKGNINHQKMIYGAISGMVQALGDPYTVFLPPSEQKQSKDDLAGSFEGVGIQLGYKDNFVAVIAPLSGTPAEKAGVKSGDFILKIKDEQKKIEKETTNMTLPEVVDLIRGPKNSEVILTMARLGKESFEVKLKRETILVKSVEVSFLEDNIAKIKLSKFGERTNNEWNQGVDFILKQNPGVKAIILDLRNNPGGFLDGAIYIASEFLENGPVVKQEDSQGGRTQTYEVNRAGKLLKIPVVVLVNEGSASASEIVAGALQVRERAKLVGQKTFGKGTIQEAEELDGGSGLHITIARWVLPNGKWIDKEGVKPDYEIKIDEKDQTKDPQLEKAIELLKQS